jgi:hypothetical protein
MLQTSGSLPLDCFASLAMTPPHPTRAHAQATLSREGRGELTIGVRAGV